MKLVDVLQKLKMKVIKLFLFPLRIIPQNIVIPVLVGANKGSKWIIGSHRHSCWVGTFEYKMHSLFRKEITERDVVYDVGANVGFYTLLSSKVVGPKGKVISFEPLPRNVFYLSRHLHLNDCSNVKIVEKAVADYSGKADFSRGSSPATAHLSSGSNLRVRTIKLDDFVKKGNPPPDCMKIDVEGAEMLVLRGAQRIIARNKPSIFLSTHSQENHQKSLKFLSSLGYVLKPINASDISSADEILAQPKD